MKTPAFLRRLISTIKDTCPARVNVDLDVWDLSGETPRLLYHVRRGNLAVLDGRNLIRDFMNGGAVTGLQRFAVGSGNVGPDENDHALGNEVFRDQFTQKTAEAGKLTLRYYLGSQDANGNTLTEAGLFGNGATDLPGTGTLYSRVTYEGLPKSSAIGVTYSWELTWEVS